MYVNFKRFCGKINFLKNFLQGLDLNVQNLSAQKVKQNVCAMSLKRTSKYVCRHKGIKQWKEKENNKFFLLYKRRLSISNNKKDLLELCTQNLIPRTYHQFYNFLPTSTAQNNSQSLISVKLIKENFCRYVSVIDEEESTRA